MLRFVNGSVASGMAVSRREWLRINTLGGLGLLAGGANLARSASAEVRSPGRRFRGFNSAKSVLVIYTSGGQSQLDTWDPKPRAPAEIRGEFAPIATRLPGVQVCEHLPRMAALADRYTIVRSMSHDDLDHGSATYVTLTGHFHARKSSNPPPSPTDHPTYGALLKRLRPAERFPYTGVHINGPALVPTLPSAGQNAGFLGRSFDPLVIGDVTSEDALVVPGLAPLPELPPVRQSSRRSLLQTVDSYCRSLERDRQRMEMDTLYRQAYELLAAPQSRQAFDLSTEPDEVRDRYGRHRPGQACLLARRLVEAGVPFVNVIWNHTNRGQDFSPEDTNVYGWDTHNDIFDALQTHLLPRFDATLSTLLEDLDQRGLLETTLVVCLGEFGRAPRIALEKRFAGASPGRKHWASVYSILMAGAGVTRGQVLGASDAIGAQPVTESYGPPDVAATLFAALGLDPHQHYLDSTGRPWPATTGRPIDALYG